MRRAIVVGSVVLLIVSIAGFITSLVLNVFVFDEYDAYGEVPIPGSATLHLPAGDATVSFHSQIIGSTSGGGLPLPDLGVTIDPPPGVAQPQLTDDVGATTTVNNDARRRVWVAHIPETGDYTVTTDGKVSAFISPRLSFGHGAQFGFLPWIFAGLFVASLLALLAATLIPRRTREVGVPFPVTPVTPTDEGIRIQQLKTLTSLHESGALTDEEFEAEKRRVLGR
jgi:Short C-terminal domain